jgi:hypothetical protein
VLRPRLTKALVGFGPDVPEGWQESNLKMVRRPDPSDFPLPDLVLFALRNVLGFPWRGPEEKVRWSVFCAFNGVLVSFEMRKFGFTICTDAEVNLDRICGQLRVAVKHVEDWLEPVAREQAAKGNVTIANRHHEFDTRYRFFRKLADRSYGRAEKKPRQKPKSKDEDLLSAAFGDLLPGWNATMRANREGFYYSTAMVDAFFSRLEHHLVLLRAFCGRPLKDDDLSAFLSMKWDKKLIALLDVTEPGMQKFYSDLKRIKERVRNPFAHGGVENDGGSLFVHIPTVGALPANFTQIRHSVRFNFIPIKKDDHGSACAAFDAFDAAMRTGPHAGAYSFVEAGIDPSFDAEHLVTYKELASAPTQEREEWFQYWHNENDRHANMDY